MRGKVLTVKSGHCDGGGFLGQVTRNFRVGEFEERLLMIDRGWMDEERIPYNGARCDSTWK